jgi:16S rRNA (uracil1498-N3)-methyltransferase
MWLYTLSGSFILIVMNICLFTPEEITHPLPLCDDRVEHLIKILHKKKGDTFSAGIIGGMAGTAVITEIDPRTASGNGTFSFTFTPETDGKQLYPLTLIIGFPRPIQLKRLLRDVAGLGASAVYLTGTELGEKSYLQSSLVERGAAYQMLLDGTVQAASTHVPELFLHKTLPDCLAEIKTAESIRVLLDNVHPVYSLTSFLKTHIPRDSAGKPKPVIAAIGSERGWTDNERMLFESEHFTRCGMGCRIFRTETAATVAAAIITAEMGVFEK